MIITSKTNNIVKYISSLKSKKYRNKYNKYVIEGIKLAQEIINSGDIVPEFIVYSDEILKSSLTGEQFLKYIQSKSNKYNIINVTKEIFEYVSDTETPQGVLAVIDKNEYDINTLKNNISSSDKFVILDKIQDPGNLGTIIRTAIGFGVKNIICIQGTVDSFTPKVVRSTMGAIRKVNIYNIAVEEIDEMVRILKGRGYDIVSTSLDTDKYINEEKIDSKTIFVMGNEANGVSNELLNCSDKLIKIPMENSMESFNVATAMAISLYEQYVRRN